MARPQKQTVDYFPHDAHAAQGTTLTIIQHEFGNDGYAFWFKLLELLARSPGHVFDCRNPARWGFLQAITLTTENQARNILSRLSELDAIESDLWQSDIIFSQNFVQRISEVYKNRHQEIPQKPVVLPKYPTPDPISTPDNPTQEGVSTPDNTQSKLKETKVNKRKEEEEPPLPPLPSSSPSSERYYSATNEAKHVSGIALLKTFTPDQQTCVDTYSQNIGLCTPIIGDKICMAIEDYTALWVLDAISEAATHEKRAWAYVIRILQTWKQAGRSNGQKGAKPHGEIRQSVTSTTDIVQQGIDSERREAAKAAARAAGRRPKPGSGLPDV